MKKVLKVMLVFVLGLSFIPAVFADETSLSSVASVTTVIGGSDKEIMQTETSGTYKFYYKYVLIDSNEFAKYVTAKGKIANLSESSDAYKKVAKEIESYETTFKGAIATVTVEDLENWTLSSDGNITLKDLKYESGKQYGYVLAVAAVKDGDTSKVYIDRLILESKSISTLGEVTVSNTSTSTTSSSTSTTLEDDESSEYDVEDEEVTTSTNPNTGLNDYILYIVPISIAIGSVILFKRKYS